MTKVLTGKETSRGFSAKHLAFGEELFNDLIILFSPNLATVADRRKRSALVSPVN